MQGDPHGVAIQTMVIYMTDMRENSSIEVLNLNKSLAGDLQGRHQFADYLIASLGRGASWLFRPLHCALSPEATSCCELQKAAEAACQEARVPRQGMATVNLKRDWNYSVC